jgi:hypothetical protein
MILATNQIDQSMPFKRWVTNNTDDLQNLFDLYCKNVDGFLNIAETSIYQKNFFDDFCKFIYNQTSSNLKIYGHKNT